MVSGRRGVRAVTLKSGAPTYQMLVEAMSEGAAILSRDGDLLYSNVAFATLISRALDSVAQIPIKSLIGKNERSRFESLLAAAHKGVAKGEFTLVSGDGREVPVYLSLNKVRGYEGDVLGLVVTDLTGPRLTQTEEVRQTEATRRLLLERVLAAQEDERRRIARELHDEAGQLLTSLLVGLRSLEDARNVVDARSRGRRLREIATRAIDEVGRLARGLHPTVLDDHGLAVALSRYVSEYTETHKIAVEISLSALERRPLLPVVEIALYRMLQEALTNVAKHARATSVSIVVAASATDVKMAVSDNGCGFDTGVLSAPSSTGLGIQSIRERAAILKGTVRFTSSRRGTRILVQIPISDQPGQPVVTGKTI
jgi:signal transduction histidine kinase